MPNFWLLYTKNCCVSIVFSKFSMPSVKKKRRARLETAPSMVEE